MRNRTNLLYSVVLLLADFFALLAAFVVAYIIRVRLDPRPLGDYVTAITFLKIFLLILPLWIVIFAVLGLYDSDEREHRLKEVMKILIACAGGTMVITFVDFLSQQPLYPARLIPVYGFGLSVLFVLTERQLLRWLRHYLYRFGIGIRRVVIVGNSNVGLTLLKALGHTRTSGYKIIAIVTDHKIEPPKDIKLYKTFEEAQQQLDVTTIDEIIQAELFHDDQKNNDILVYAHSHHIDYKFYPTPTALYSAKHSVSLIGGLPVIEVHQTPLDGWGRVIKRVFDVVSSLILIVLLAPLMLLLWLLIKLLDPGPAIFTQKRLTRFGESFQIYKFRTLQKQYSGRDALEVFKEMGREDLVIEYKERKKVHDDPRLSGIGKWLRSSSLDELPQLWNILKGDISLVGPRPYIEEELKQFGHERSVFLSLKPGVTGLWQVSGRNQLSFEQRVELEVYYAQNWSLFLDIKILLKTIRVVLRREGAE